MPLVKIMKGNKKEKILDYTAAVIASDVIKTAGTEILGGERSSFWMIYSNRLSNTGLQSVEELIIYKYVNHYKNDRKRIIDMINQHISMVGLKVAKINELNAGEIHVTVDSLV